MMKTIAPCYSSGSGVPVTTRRRVPTSSREIFELLESNVRRYCRSFPTVFDKAKGALICDQAGNQYIDFLAGGGALDYGHNPDFIKHRLVEYLMDDRLIQGLDLHTAAKREFLDSFHQIILQPRGLDFKVQFCGSSEADAHAAATNLARRATQRTRIVSFPGIAQTESDSLDLLASLCSGVDAAEARPAAVMIETVQSEGGFYVASSAWLKSVRALCDRYGMLLIVDDVQTGCGRTGKFFSFEHAGVMPDIVCMSKSIGGYGLPLSLVLMRRELDCWEPGEHACTFGGQQLSYVAGTAALELWKDRVFERQIAHRSEIIESFLKDRIVAIDARITFRGLGMLWGVDLSQFGSAGIAQAVSQRCFENGLIIECGSGDDQTLRVLPPLNISEKHLCIGLEILASSISYVVQRLTPAPGTGSSTIS